jgi:hypothetical protein
MLRCALCVFVFLASCLVALPVPPAGAAGFGDRVDVAFPDFLGYSLTCRSASLCLGFNQPGGTVSSSSPSTTWHYESAPGMFVGTRAAVCPAADRCVVGGGLVRNHKQRPTVGVTSDPASGAPHWTLTALPVTLTASERSQFKSLKPQLRRTVVGRLQASIRSLDCPSTNLCVALGGGGSDGGARMWWSTTPAVGASWKARTAEEFGNHEGGFQGEVSCPDVSLCVASERGARMAVLQHPTRASSRWRIFRVAGATRTYDVDCPSAKLCVAISKGGKIVLTSTNPAGGPSSWHAYTIKNGHVSSTIGGESCPQVDFCMFAGNGGRGGTVWTTTDPAAGPSAWQAITSPFGRRESFFLLSCASSQFCVLNNHSGAFYVYS